MSLLPDLPEVIIEQNLEYCRLINDALRLVFKAESTSFEIDPSLCTIYATAHIW
jgi:hypothetical protein